jgi:hypothetical protein
MRVPEFTADVSLYQPRGNYAGYSTSAGHAGTDPVIAQFDLSTFGGDYWSGVATQYFFCQPPCGRDKHGNCLCPRVGAPVGGPLLPPGIAG